MEEAKSLDVGLRGYWEHRWYKCQLAVVGFTGSMKGYHMTRTISDEFAPLGSVLIRITFPELLIYKISCDPSDCAVINELIHR